MELVGHYQQEVQVAGAAEKKVRVVMTCDTTQRYIILSHVICLDEVRVCCYMAHLRVRMKGDERRRTYIIILEVAFLAIPHFPRAKGNFL